MSEGWPFVWARRRVTRLLYAYKGPKGWGSVFFHWRIALFSPIIMGPTVVLPSGPQPSTGCSPQLTATHLHLFFTPPSFFLRASHHPELPAATNVAHSTFTMDSSCHSSIPQPEAPLPPASPLQRFRQLLSQPSTSQRRWPIFVSIVKFCAADHY